MKRENESKTVSNYRKCFKKFGKEISTNDLDYQDALQDAILDSLEKGKTDQTIANIRHETKCNYLNLKEKFARYDLTADNLESEIFNRNTGEVVEAKNAIKQTLKPLEQEIIDLYGQGYTFEKIAELKALNSKMEAKRLYDKASKKIDSLKIAYLYDCRYATYQFKGKRDKPKFKPKPEANGIPIKRNYLCLDQFHDMPKQYRNGNYDANLCPTKPKDFEVIEFISLPFSIHVNRIVKTINGSWLQNSDTIGLTRNKELIQIKANEAKYNKMLMNNYKKPEKIYRFGNGKHISFDGKYINI